ncbi:MAG: DUF4286 family protein [Bacteroidetes bacterium]|nr:DUF4286 family protein [Bacteroidota bacterium]MBS1977319.1 DUF4286 family protein [Bacteroidota bacterium]
MLIYNVTSGVDKDIEQEWLAWMKETHIPEVMKTQMFVSFRIYKVLSAEEDSISYAVQYAARSLDQLEAYLDQFAPKLREDVQKKFGSKVVSFRTLLQEV